MLLRLGPGSPFSVARSKAAPVLLFGWGLLIGAWVLLVPPGGAPDETAHLVKALGAAQGEWSGEGWGGQRPVPLSEEQARFFDSAVRSFALPPGLPTVPEAACFNVRSTLSASCQAQDDPPHPTPDRRLAAGLVGRYNPAVYIPIGLAAVATDSPMLATYLGRVATAVLSLLLLLGALRCAGHLEVFGSMLAATPALLALAAALSTSGIAAAAGLCFAAASLTLGTAPEARETYVWWGLGGAFLASSHPLGPLWLLLIVLVVGSFVGRDPLLTLSRTNPGRLAVAGTTVLFALYFNAWWTVSRLPSVSKGAEDGSLGYIPPNLAAAAKGLVGLFGWNDAQMPALAYALYSAALLSIVALSFTLGTRSQRLVVAGVALAVPALLVGLDVFTQRPLGFAVQGRYALPFAIVLPLLALRTVGERWRSFSPAAASRLLLAMTAVMVVLQGVAVWFAARRFAVGTDGPLVWLSREEWHPPGGWGMSLSLASTGLVLLFASGSIGSRELRGARRTG